jgi:hypothetical protein
MQVTLYGAGRLSHNVAQILQRRQDVGLVGPLGRDRRVEALTSGADVVVIATSSFLHEVAPDIELAVRAESNVITSSEEAAFPWAVDAALAGSLDVLAKDHGVTIVGCGLNPGFSFDALVLTVAGATSSVTSIRVDRVIDLSKFAPVALRQLGVGFTERDFDLGAARNAIRGHIGFAESMNIVAAGLGVELERVDQELSPIIATRDYECEYATVSKGLSAGVYQREIGVENGQPWFEARFTAHVDPQSIGKAPLDQISIQGDPPVHLVIDPGLNSQRGAAALIANSIRRVEAATAGWLSVRELRPASPM